MQKYRLFLDGHFPEPSINPSNALLMGIGNSTGRAQANAAGRNFLSFYFENYATSGDNRGMYLRQYLSGAGAGGEAARLFTTVNNVAAGTAHGAHISLSFGTTGTVTGLGVASRNTLHIANQATQAGTLAASQAELYADGSASGVAGTDVTMLRFIVDGHADGIANIVGAAGATLFTVVGVATGGDGVNSLFRSVEPSTLAASLKVKVGSTLYYLPLYSGQS
jgi:hypothetical protein